MKTISTLLLVFATLYSLAQEPVVTWKEISKEESQFKAIVADPRSGNLVKLSLQREGKKKNTKWNALLTKYDGSLNMLHSTALASPTEEGRYEYLFQVGDKSYAVFRKPENDAVYSFSVQQIDLESLQPVGKLIPVGTFQVIANKAVNSKPYLLSSDGKRVLFSGFVQDEKAKTSGFILAQFDENMQEQWRKSLSNSKSDYHRIIGLTNQGVAICYKAEYSSGKSPESKVTLLQVSGSGETDPIPVEVPGQYVNAVYLMNETAGGYRLFGLTAQMAGRGHSGYFTADVDLKAKKLHVIAKDNFSLSLLQKLAKREEAFNQPLHATPSFLPIEIMTRGDVTHVLLEASGRDPLQHIRDSRNAGKRFIPESEIVWINGSILEIRLSSDGSSSVNHFYKEQYTDATDMLGSGFAVLMPKDDLIFVYNGWRRNIENDKPVERNAFGYSEYNKSSLIYSKMEADGSTERKVLFDNKPNGFYPAVAHFFKLNDKKLILVGSTSLDPQEVSKEALGILELR